MSKDDICPVCGKIYRVHVYPEKVPCPKCGQIDEVHAWEAWGHPNGQLECLRCNDPQMYTNYDDPVTYQTFYKSLRTGKTIIVPWHRSEKQNDNGDRVIK